MATFHQLTHPHMKKFIIILTVFVSISQFSIFQFLRIDSVRAYSVGDVVINEIAWAGSGDASGDEWIELFNPTNQKIDLSSWVIVDDGSAEYKIDQGEIAPHGYFLIEDNEDAVSDLKADALIPLSLANAGDSLTLKDSAGVLVDKVNSSGGAWYGGNSENKASMERIDPGITNDEAENFGSAVSSNGSKSSGGSVILGTPRSANSIYGGSGVGINFNDETLTGNLGETVDLTVGISDAVDLYAYGFEINYPSEILSFVSAEKGTFLKVGNTETAFYASLKDGKEGTLIAGEARLLNPPKGVDGDGELLHLKFKIISESGEGQIGFGAGSFVSDVQGDIVAKFGASTVAIGNVLSKLSSVKDLKISNGKERFSLKIMWEVSDKLVDFYVVKKLMPDGSFITIGETEELYFIDGDDVQNSGKIIPNVEYKYQIIAVKNGAYSAPIDVLGIDDRGLKGDNDRSDSVDGKDIERLARSYGSNFGDKEYDMQKDSSFDGSIDGDDLIDIGANFGLTY